MITRPRELAQLEELIRSEDPAKRREGALKALDLGRQNGAAVVPSLIPLLTDVDPSVVAEGVNAIRKNRAASAIPDLTRVLGAVDDGLQRPWQVVSPAAALRRTQCWLRDATVAEIRHYIDRQKQRHRRRYHAWSSLEEEFAEDEPSERPFSHPHYWAAYTVAPSSLG